MVTASLTSKGTKMAKEPTDLELMNSPSTWPQNPYLPLQKGNVKAARDMESKIAAGEISFEMAMLIRPPLEFGFLVEGFGPLVFLGNYEKGSKRHVKYESLQAIIADGWQID